MKNVKSMAALVFFILLTNHSLAQDWDKNPQPNQLKDDKKAIELVRNAEVLSIKEQKMEKFLPLLHEHYIAAPPGEPRIIGKKSIKNWLLNNWKTSSFSSNMQSKEIIILGDMAVDRGHFNATLSMKDSNGAHKPYAISGSYLWLYMREDEKWKILGQTWELKNHL